MKKLMLLLMMVLALLPAWACSHKSGNAVSKDEGGQNLAALRDTLQRIADSNLGEIGIALITDRGDTLLVNNETKYPLMSVFKLHCSGTCSQWPTPMLS